MTIKYILLATIIGAIMLGIWLVFIKPSTSPTVQNKPIASEWAELYPVENDEDRASLEKITQETFSDFIEKKAGIYGWQTFNKDAKQIPITIGLSTLGVQIPLEMIPVLDAADWGIRSCKSSTDKPSFVLRLLFPVGTGGTLVTYSDKQSMMKKWEKTMLSDVQSVIFPESFYGSNVILNSQFVTKYTSNSKEFRQASVAVKNIITNQFNYMIVADYVLIGNDATCMTEFADDLLGVVP